MKYKINIFAKLCYHIKNTITFIIQEYVTLMSCEILHYLGTHGQSEL